MTDIRSGRGTEALGPERPPWFNIPSEVRTRSAGPGEPLEGEDTYPDPDYQTEPMEAGDAGAAAMPDPIEVVIVGGTPAPLTDWSSQSFEVAATPIRLGGRNKNRRRMVVSNSGDTNGCRILRQSTDLPSLGYVLAVGEQLEMTHNEEVWVVCVAAETTTVNAMTEYVVESGE